MGIPRSRLRSYPHELSGGMRQRVMIAMALATDPEVVIMDEPTTALDVVVQRDILAQIVELKERLGFSIMFITHDLSLLLELADRIAVMYAGQLLEIGTSGEIHREPSHPYTKGLLNLFPSLRGPRRDLTGIPGSPPDLRDPPPGCPFLPRCAYGTSACEEVDMQLLADTGQLLRGADSRPPPTTGPARHRRRGNSAPQPAAAEYQQGAARALETHPRGRWPCLIEPAPHRARSGGGRWETIRYALDSNVRTFRLCSVLVVATMAPSDPWSLAPGRLCEVFTRLCRAARG